MIVGKESFRGGKLIRILVQLDDPNRWSFGNITDVAAFFESEVSPNVKLTGLPLNKGEKSNEH